MLFNCLLEVSDLLNTQYIRAIEIQIWKNNWDLETFEIRGRSQEFAKIFRSLEQFIQAVKGQNNFW